MALYSLESVNSPQRVANQFVAVDTSYLISLSSPLHPFNPCVSHFHTLAQHNNIGFVTSVVVRQEFIKKIRTNTLADAMLNLANSDPAIYLRYQTLIRAARNRANIRPLVNDDLVSCCEAIVKDHAKTGDTPVLLGAIANDIWGEVQRLENLAGLLYASGGGGASWDDLGTLMGLTGIAATDGMIANMAMFLEIESIVTTDCDFVCVSDILDIYMPQAIAAQCSVYDPSND